MKSTVMSVKGSLKWPPVACVLIGTLGVFFLLINESYQGRFPPSKEQMSQPLRRAINEILHDAVRNGLSFTSMENKEVVKVLDQNDYGGSLNSNHIERNKEGEILDLWGRPYVFYRRGKQVCVFTYKTPH
jgi:hypothetical protein